MPIYSIVVPCYNVAPYLPVFLSMIPTDRSDFELIFVDDGSTDNTLNILQSFVKKNKNFFVYKHLRNKGVACALNTALSKIKTRWFARLDPDDFVYPLYFETIPLFLKPHATIVRYKYKHFKNNKTHTPWWMRFYFKKAFGWSCIFNLDNFGVPSYKQGCLSDDLEMFARQYKRNPKQAEIFINKYLVGYRYGRPGSIVNSTSLKRVAHLELALKTYWQNREIPFLTRCLQVLFIYVDLWKCKHVLAKKVKK